ncbi:TSUP family transporter [Aestuariivivens sp. NBU2969]
MKMTLTTVLILILIGILTGVFSGLLGVGGGLIMIPMFVFFLGFSQHMAQGLSLAVMLPPVTFLAVLNYHKAGAIDWKMALIVSVLFMISGYFGSKLALRIDQAFLKKIFGVFIILVGIKMILGK